MTPTTSRQTKKPVMKSRQVQVQAKVPSRFTQSVNVDEQVRQFREARKAREAERMDKLRHSRLKNSSAAASTMSASMSITSIASSTSCSVSKQARDLRLKSSSVTTLTVPASLSSTSVASSSSCRPPKPPVSKILLKSKATCSTNNSSTLNQKSQQQTTIKTSTNDCKSTTKRLLSAQQSIKHCSSVKSRRSNGARLSISKRKPEFKTSGKKPVRKAPRAEVKLTKTAQLRMMKSDPLLELSQFKRDSSKRIVLPLPATVPKQVGDSKNMSNVLVEDFNEETSKSQVSLSEKSGQNKSSMKKTSISDSSLKKKVSHASESPSHIPRKKTSFVSPLRRTMPSTPKPSPLRARLEEWLVKNDQSLDNFKHLKCFGVLGPVVKRPQTPFRKVILSSSTLRAIPESSESASIKEKVEDISDDDDVVALNSTFTLEDEDKENIGFDAQPKVLNPNVEKVLSPKTLKIKELDQAHGILSELHRLIKMAYPIEQCELWLKAIRRRFPQCGEEPIYWECLASLEETRGDLQSAVACYERAILQGAEGCVQSSLDQLLQKMSDLHIEPILSIDVRSTKKLQTNLTQSSNIIKSSSIQFAVQEKCNSSRRNVMDEDEDDSVFTATPVRRSMRLAGTPSRGTPGVTCVRSLEFLEPKVKNSLIFHGNSALDPRD